MTTKNLTQSPAGVRQQKCPIGEEVSAQRGTSCDLVAPRRGCLFFGGMTVTRRAQGCKTRMCVDGKALVFDSMAFIGRRGEDRLGAKLSPVVSRHVSDQLVRR